MTVTTLPWETIGPGAVLTFVVVLILTGRLVPRRALEDTREDRDYERQARERSEAARAILSDAVMEHQHQMSELLKHAETTQAFISALQNALNSRSEPNGEADT